MSEEEKIFDLYVREYYIESANYRLMGKMLDKEFVNQRMKAKQIEQLYIYGGTYLGIQLYNAIEDKNKILAIADKNGMLAVKMHGIPVIKIDELKKQYSGEKIIVTPLPFYSEIKAELSEFVKEHNILLIGELLEGI